MDVEFIIPSKHADLRKLSTSQYYVADVSTSREISEEFLSFREMLSEEGVEFIFKAFDKFYSIIKNFSELSADVKLDCYEVLLQVGNLVLNELVILLEDAISEIARYQFKFRNLMKMSLYLLCALSDCFEEESQKPSLISVAGKKGGRKKKKTLEDCAGWPDKRHSFVKCVNEICRLPITKLWTPPVVEEEFINIIIKSFLTILENPDVVHETNMVNQIVNFLGYSLKTYRTQLGLCIRIVDMIQRAAHSVPILSNGVQLFISEYEATNIIQDLFKEISHNETEETARLHLVSQFVMEITEKLPYSVLSSMKYLLPCLQEESHIMRNCILSIIGELTVSISRMETVPQEISAMRDQLLDKFYCHMWDLNSFVRCKSLQILSKMFSEGAVPLKYEYKFFERAMGRLLDKASTVRKNAISFLKIFYLVNVFAIQITLEDLQNSYEKEKATLQELVPLILSKRPKNAIHFNSDDEDEANNEQLNDHEDRNGNDKNEDVENGNENGEKECNDNADVEKCNGEADPIPNGINGDDHNAEPSAETEENESSRSQALKDKIDTQKVLVAHLQRTLQFAEALKNNLPTLCALLKSSTPSDSLEAINFFVTTFQLGFKDSVLGVKGMMNLIFSKEPAIKNAIVAAFKKMYLTVLNEEGETGNTLPAATVAQNLILMLRGTSDVEAFAIAELIKEFVKSKEVSQEVINILWDKYALNSSTIEDWESIHSIAVIGMIADVDDSIVLKNLNIIAEVGFGPRAFKDFHLVRESCDAILKINRKAQQSENDISPAFRLPKDHKVFKRLSHILVTTVSDEKDNRWMPMCQSAIGVIFRLADKPEEIAMDIIKKIFVLLSGRIKNQSDDNAMSPAGKIIFMMLRRFLSLSGSFAQWLIIFLENDVYNEMKRATFRKTATAEKPKVRRLSRVQEKSRGSESGDLNDSQSTENEFLIEEFLRKICDDDLLNENNFLINLFQIIIWCCKWSISASNSDICAPASIAMAKFMGINEKTCDDNLQLLVTIMEKFPDPVIRSNIVIAIGDLFIKFPNVVQPWSLHLYYRLKDDSSLVRKTTVITLTHLILEDMIKAKSQIGDVAKCIVDEEDIAKSAKFLFRELSKKQNVLYNLLPDIISVLSDDSAALSDEDYQTITKYIFQFIEKDRQIGMIVEKLCQRLRDAKSPLQMHKVAFSLTLLHLNDKCFQKLVENKGCFNKQLDDDVLRKYMKDILHNVKSANPKLVAEVQAFMTELNI